MNKSMFAAGALLVATFNVVSHRAAADFFDISAETAVLVTDLIEPTFLFELTTGTSALNIGGLSATATIDLQPSPNLTVTAQVDGIGQALAGTFLLYNFIIIGPPDIEIPVIITASGEVTPAAETADARFFSWSATAILDIMAGGTSTPLASACQATGFLLAYNACDYYTVQPSFPLRLRCR